MKTIVYYTAKNHENERVIFVHIDLAERLHFIQKKMIAMGQYDITLSIFVTLSGKVN